LETPLGDRLPPTQCKSPGGVEQALAPYCIQIVTNLCWGGKLFDRIVRKLSDVENNVPCFTEDTAARIMYAQHRGVVHRGNTDAHTHIAPEVLPVVG
jgi:hypothetical protein